MMMNVYAVTTSRKDTGEDKTVMVRARTAEEARERMQQVEPESLVGSVRLVEVGDDALYRHAPAIGGIGWALLIAGLILPVVVDELFRGQPDMTRLNVVGLALFSLAPLGLIMGVAAQWGRTGRLVRNVDWFGVIALAFLLVLVIALA